MPSSPRKRGRPFALTREQIGEAVLALGLADFSVKELAARLGVSEKTLYNYAPGRNGLKALGMEQAMRRASEEPHDFWTSETNWRELLEGVAEGAWELMNALPGVGELIAQGVHSRAEAEFTADAGEALMERGFTADQAIEALALVFSLVTTAFVDAQRMDVPSPGETEAERDHIAHRLAPPPNASPAHHELFDATVRAMWEPTKDMLDRRLALVLDGMQRRYGLD